MYTIFAKPIEASRRYVKPPPPTRLEEGALDAIANMRSMALLLFSLTQSNPARTGLR